MNPETPLLLEHATEEVAALIATLHATGRRLEQLTAGEVDTVADHEGHAFLLGRAQEQLRHIEASKQAAILNALPAHIALLDARGVILSVNEAWRRFGSAAAAQCPGHEIGVNYLDICDRANEGDPAHQVAEGIRSVLEGRAKSFAIECPCDSPTERRWFLLTANPLAEEHSNGAVVMLLDITRSRLTQAALAQSEDGLHRAEVMAKLAHVITAADGSFEHWSETLPHLLGVEPAQLPRTTRAWLELLHPEDQRRFRDAAVEAGAEKRRAEVEYRLQRADGEWINVRQTMEPLKTVTTEGLRWFNTLQDVTAQRRTEESLRASEARFRQMADNIRDVFFLVEAQTSRTLYLSPAFEEIWGRSRDSVYADTDAWTEAIHPDDRAPTYDKYRQGISTGTFEYDYRIVRPDGAIRWIEARGFPVRDDAGKIVRIAGIASDITERKRVASELWESERRFSNLLRNVELVSLMLDTNGRITYGNDYLLRLTGWQREEIIGRDWFELFIPPEAKAVRASFAALLANRSAARHGENEILTRSGERRLIRWNNSVLRSGDGEVAGTASIGEDITEQKRAESRIKRLNRVYAVLSGINTLIVRVRDRDELFKEACRIAVQSGQFLLALVAVADPHDQLVKAVAWAGDEGGFAQLTRPTQGQGKPGLSAQAIATRAPAVCNDIEADGSGMRYPQEALERGYRSAAALPLVVDGTAIGALMLYAAEAGFFDDEEMRLLEELAGDISFAIGHIEKARKLDRITRVNAILSGINGAIVRIREPQELFEEACRIAVETGGLPFAWFGVVDDAGMRLLPVASAGTDGGFLEMIRDRLSLRDDAPAGHGVAARSVRQKRATVLHDVDVHVYPKYKALYAERGIKTVAAFPLLVAGRAVGALGLLATEAGFFDAEEMKLLNEVTANIAFALEHIEKEEKVRRLTRVYAVLSGINTLIVRVRDRDELFKEACRIAVQSGQFLLALVAVADPRDQLVKAVAWAGDEGGFAQLTRPTIGMEGQGKPGLSAQAMATRAPAVCNDIEADGSGMRYPKEALERGYRSAAALPLAVDGTAIGALMLYAAEAGFFDDEEMRLLEELAGDISLAIGHIEKAAKLDRTTRMNAVLSGINGAIVRIREPQELFEEACRIAVETGGLAFSWLCVLDEAEERLRPVASAGPKDGFLELISGRFSLRDDAPEGHGIGARAVRAGRALVVNDIQAAGLKYKKAHADRGIKAAAALPLFVAGRIVAVFGLHAGEVGFFDAEEMKLLDEVAANIAFALEHMAAQQKLENLSRIRAVSSEINAAIVRIPEREGLLRETARIAVEHGKFELVWLATLDHEEKKVHPVAAPGFSTEAAHGVSWASISAVQGTLGEAMQTRKPAVRNDIGEMPIGKLRQEAVQKGCRSTVCLPLVVDDKVVALIALFAQGVGFFDSKELALLNEVAADVSFALQAIEQRKELEYRAYYDVLTGLANRALFLERVAQYMRSATSGGHKLALFVLDLARFKNINDSLGRPAGDALLKQVAEWLTRNVADANLVARVGADQFAVVLPQVRQGGDVTRLLEKSMGAFLEHPFRLNDAVFRIALKVGVALFPDDGDNADTIFKNAEAALKRAKASGERYLSYTQEMTARAAGKLTLENHLRQALDREEFVLHYQPKVSLASGKLTSVEALIRWNDPRTGLVPPGRFIPVLEETGLILDVGRWALRKALEDYLRWRAAGLAAVRVAVNVSPLQLRHRDFIAEIKQIVGIDAQAAAGLELEITEGVIMEDIKHNIASLKAIRAMGLTIAIDDFGTGFSSLAYLSKLPVDTLKIDRSFVIDMTGAPEGLALVSTIIGLAHSLKLKVVAEGVETEEQSRLLRLLSCDEMQGYLFSKPVPAEVFETRFLAAPVAV
jgi:diguanylate cyclase (GGDEF)-like protein/PAS domain S-box-containing protein